MKYRYTKYTGSLLDEIDIDDLVSKLSDLLLSSGFSNPWGGPSDEEDRTMQALHDAILEALFSGGMLSDEAIQQLLGEPADGDQEQARQQLEDLVQQIIERMMEQGFVSGAPDLEQERERREGMGGGFDDSAAPVKFEVTDKALDFLGLPRAARSAGLDWAQRHRPARHASSQHGRRGGRGPEALRVRRHAQHRSQQHDSQCGAAAGLEFRIPDPGFLAAIGTGIIEVDYPDLMVAQSEYQSSCATVIMLDCSHSMILYGEDRFTPAKRVALALAHLIRTQYPGDSLRAVLFHDSAEEIPLKQLGRVRVGPYYTNTREGLRLARRILERQKKDMRQIVMITDGKPSALTRPDGQIYKNAFGLDPFIVSETFAEVNACQKAGIMINTFMLARDHDLVAFVRRVAAICRGKAYFTTPYTLGQYVLMDYMDRKTKTIH